MNTDEMNIRAGLSGAASLDSGSAFSCSQYRRFTECEARALAIVKKEWAESNTVALLFGKYFHTWFEGRDAFDRFTEERREDLFTKKGELYAEFKRADALFRKVETDGKARHFAFDGLHEVEISGTIGGVAWRGRIDVLNVEEHWFCDLKAVKDIYEGEWVFREDEFGVWRNRKTTFIEAQGYHRQMAVYRELLRQHFDADFAPLMLAVDKKENPAIELIGFIDFLRLKAEIAEIEIKQQRYGAIKRGETAPEYCGKCDFCRSRKRVTEMITPKDLERMVV